MSPSNQKPIAPHDSVTSNYHQQTSSTGRRKYRPCRLLHPLNPHLPPQHLQHPHPLPARPPNPLPQTPPPHLPRLYNLVQPPKHHHPTPTLFFSSLGTTRAQAGSIEAQRKIDYDLNLALATTFSQSPAPKKIYILISTSGANPTSMIPYSRMKGELEDSVKALALGNENTNETQNTGLNQVIIILRPGLIVGTRSDSRPPEFVMRKVAGLAGWINPGLKDFWAQDAEVIGRAAVNAGLRALEGKDGENVVPRVWELGMADIVRLGRTEWKEE
ncbi:hypothetical protein DID88_007898 [Monilinia fructigena]|uniref:NAD(P)-binding domain-containing protein n=1 Tax=Monilinia fructigena TaxID=38457 RepID=A0A395J8T6_9HELO|nr:hypothetical protein DID88_007898 [Monilinia fructigena]